MESTSTSSRPDARLLRGVFFPISPKPRARSLLGAFATSEWHLRFWRRHFWRLTLARDGATRDASPSILAEMRAMAHRLIRPELIFAASSGVVPTNQHRHPCLRAGSPISAKRAGLVRTVKSAGCSRAPRDNERRGTRGGVW